MYLVPALFAIRHFVDMGSFCSSTVLYTLPFLLVGRPPRSGGGEAGRARFGAHGGVDANATLREQADPVDSSFLDDPHHRLCCRVRHLPATGAHQVRNKT